MFVETRAKCLEVSATDGARVAETLMRVVKDHLNFDCLGLAAPQIGLNARVFLARVGNLNSEDHGFVTFINPVLETSGSKVVGPEGCLSIGPDPVFYVPRFEEVTVWDLLFGEDDKITYRGLDARILQHEFDHLNGRMICDLGTTKVGRNEPCPCGSGKKYKKCCL